MNTCTYIVTGATGGIGRAIVEALAREEGSHIIMAVRRPEAAAQMVSKMPHAPGVTFEALPLDLASTVSVDEFAREILNRNIAVDALINNAGVMPGRVIVTPEGHEMATQVNYISTRRLTEHLLNAVSPGGVITFTTSVTRKIVRCRPDWDEHARTHHGVARRFVTYGRSKRMIAGYAHTLAQRLAPRGIRVNCSDPGIADTGMITMDIPVVDALATLLFRPVIHTAAQGAEAALRAVRSDRTDCIFTLRGCTQNSIDDLHDEQTAPPRHS